MNDNTNNAEQENTAAQEPDFQASRAQPLHPSEGENLDKIRDILFGSQKKDYESRFLRLEQELRQRSSELRDEINSHFQSLEIFIKEELSTINTRLEREQDDRHRAVQNLSREVKDLIHQKVNELDTDLRKLNILKADRAMIATLLTDVAARLVDDKNQDA